MTAPGRSLPWGLWLRQIAGVLRMEVRKSFFGRRALLIYLLAIMPVIPLALLIIGTAIIGSLPPGLEEIGATMFFANAVFQVFILRLTLYLGCVWIFMNLFRGEILDRSLHYYFLTPIRREVLVVAKFLSGWLAATVLFGLSTLVSFVLLHSAFGLGEFQRYMTGPGVSHLLAYLSVTAIACLGYGAVFLLIGLFFRNPVIPAILIWGWENLNPMLPAALKKISVVHYLQSMSPVTPTEGPLAILAEPTPVWIAVPGLIVLAAAMLTLAALRIRRTEIHYGAD